MSRRGLIGLIAGGLVLAGASDGIALLALHQHWPDLIVNPGIGFGWLRGSPALALGLSVLGLAAALVLAVRFPRGRLPVTLVLAGGVANLVLRVGFGHVIDYWRLPPYPYTFNLADAAIRLGSLWFIGAVLVRPRGAEPGRNQTPPGNPPGGVVR